MKKFLTLITLFWAFNAPLLAQDPEPGQTPDVVREPKPGETEALNQDFKLPPNPNPMDPKEKALFQNAYDGKLAEVKALITKGVSVNLVDKKGRTPLIMAAHNGHTAVVEFLFGKGADINAKDNDGQTALMYATKRSFVETVAFLLKNGADVNVQSKKRGVTALMIASASGNVELVRMLIEHGANSNLTDAFGRTAKVLAQKKGNSAVVDLLPDPTSPVSVE